MSISLLVRLIQISCCNMSLASVIPDKFSEGTMGNILFCVNRSMGRLALHKMQWSRHQNKKTVLFFSEQRNLEDLKRQINR